MTHYIPGFGPIGAKIVIVGESPSFAEVEQGKPFVGPSGRELDTLLKAAGIRREECWLTNVCKYFVTLLSEKTKIPFPIRAKREGIDLDEQIRELLNEINSINPNLILALGGTALWALTGKKSIQNYRGSILSGPNGRKVIATYHPAHLLHQKGGEIKGYWVRQIIIFDLRRVKEESTFPEIVLPSRNLAVCESSAHLENFIEQHKDEPKLSIDIEALDCIPSCIGIAFNKYHGLSIPLWNVRGISTIPDSDLCNIWIILSRLLVDSRYKKVGQNFKYDQDKIKRLGFAIDKLHSDTMLKAFVINPELPKSLAFNTSIYTKEPYYKDEGKEFDITKQSIKDLFIYNARDACVTVEIDDTMDGDLDSIELRDFYENFVMQLHPLYMQIENEGFRVDEKRREELLRKYISRREHLSYELFSLLGAVVNPNSPKQVAICLYDNLKLPRREGVGEEVLTALLPQIKKEENKRIIEIILESRQVTKTIDSVLSIPDFDGRMRTSYYLCLETGRTSTRIQEPPVRPRVPTVKNKKGETLGMAFQTITKHGEVGADIRTMFIADEGEILVQADSSQAEARVVALLSDDDEMLAMYDLHDIHALTASWFFGGSESTYSKKVLGHECPQRFAGKTLRHAGHLGASKKRAATELNTQARKYKIDFSITEAEAERALKIFHEKSPKIRSVFHAQVIECVQKTRSLTAPLPYGIESKTGGKRTFFERMGDELFRQAFSYLPQRAVSDNTKAAALRIRKRVPNIRILLESHDSLLFSVKEDKVDEIALIIKEEMEKKIDFSNCSLPRRNLSIPCELEIGPNYKDLSKFRFREQVSISSLETLQVHSD